MKKLKYFCLLLILFSCKKHIELDKDFSQTKPVLNCFFSPQDSLFVNLTQSRSPLVSGLDSFEVLQNANIKIYENNLQQSILFDFNGYYYKAQNFSAKPNCKYKIEITTEDNKVLTAEDSIISASPINWVLKEKLMIENFNYAKVTFNFSDNKDVTNYYWLNVYAYWKPIDAKYWGTYLSKIETNDPVLANWSGYKDKIILFTDEKFNGLNYNMSFNFFISYEDSIKVVFKLNSVSQGLYNYLKSVQKQGENPEFPNPLEEPTFIYSNVKGGLGIFGAYNSSIDSIKFATNFLK